MQMSTFQIFFLATLVIITILGVMVFALHGGVSGQSTVGKVTIWGTVDKDLMDKTLQDMRGKDKDFSDVVYEQKDASTFDTDLVNAMASGSGPDLVILPQDELLTFSNKLATIPYSMISQQTYTNSFIDEGQMFLTPQGPIMLPFMVDPLVLYWNRDLFSNAGLPLPPQYWSDVLTIAPKLTVSTPDGSIQQSAIGMGEWSNVLYAKDILSMLILQAGDPITIPSTDVKTEGPYQVVLGKNTGNSQEVPAVSALQFYTDFANPAKTSYTWDQVLPSTQDAFVAGDLAMYIGYASDYSTLSARNPNLNFGVALMPQVQGGGSQLTFGRLLGLAIPRTAPNLKGAATIALALTSQQAIASLASHNDLPPVRRDVSVNTSNNAAAAVFVQSALIAHAWLDPNPTQTDDVFKGMIESVLSGKSLPNEALANASLTMLQEEHPTQQQ